METFYNLLPGLLFIGAVYAIIIGVAIRINKLNKQGEHDDEQ